MSSSRPQVSVSLPPQSYYTYGSQLSLSNSHILGVDAPEPRSRAPTSTSVRLCVGEPPRVRPPLEHPSLYRIRGSSEAPTGARSSRLSIGTGNTSARGGPPAPCPPPSGTRRRARYTRCSAALRVRRAERAEAARSASASSEAAAIDRDTMRRSCAASRLPRLGRPPSSGTTPSGPPPAPPAARPARGTCACGRGATSAAAACARRPAGTAAVASATAASRRPPPRRRPRPRRRATTWSSVRRRATSYWSMPSSSTARSAGSASKRACRGSAVHAARRAARCFACDLGFSSGEHSRVADPSSRRPPGALIEAAPRG